MKLISQGAEGFIYKDGDLIIKDRPKKSYRINILDDSLRRQRTKREIKVLNKLKDVIKVPKVVREEKYKIFMEYIDGKNVSKIITEDNYIKIAKKVGKNTAIMHNNNIIHGDLTTSNMIIKEDEIYFIDFGLSFFSHRIEDRAVDLHLIRQAIEAKHYKVYPSFFVALIDEYKKTANNAKQIAKRLEIVEGRGRNKSK